MAGKITEMMVRRNILIAAAFMLAISSCGDSTPEGDQSKENTNTEQSDQSGAEMGSDKAKADGQQSQNSKPKLEREEIHKRFTENRPELSKDRNTTSPYKYIQTSEEFSAFFRVVSQTSFAKYMHGKPVTLFAPTNEAMNKLPASTLERLSGAEDANLEREAFVARHLVDGAIADSKLDDIPDLKDLRGKRLMIDTDEKGNRSINGIDLRSSGIQLGRSVLIAVNEVLPEEMPKQAN